MYCYGMIYVCMFFICKYKIFKINNKRYIVGKNNITILITSFAKL